MKTKVTYSDASVHTSGHQVHVVELETCYCTGVTDQTAMNLSASKIPQTHHTVCGTARKGRLKDLQSANKVG
jgi:hypothetical protein